jgi:predicted DNA-binding WGR domain protein
MPTLTNIDPAHNMYRFYTVRVSQNLFGQWSVLREWGRIGSLGRLRCDTYDSESEAREAESRSVRLRLRHGYYFARDFEG